jgi:hypothetical protein
MEEWMAVIRNNVGYLLDHTSVMKSSDNELETIVDPREQNRFCADCGAPDPSWCCINWATCICIKCSGVHREMSIEVSKVRSLTLDHLDSNILSLFALIGNERANAILTEELPDDLRINEGTDRADRDAFLRRKYEKCEFVNITEPVDVSTAIQNGDALSAFKGICQMKKLASIDNNLLKLAAGLGNVSLCLLVGLNTPRLDLLDDGGWSALSYAAYFGNIRAAEALMAIGCRVESAPEAHPYAIAIAKSHTDMASLFLPYWNGQIDPEKTFQPPLSFDQEGSRDPFLISAEPHDEAE